MAEESYRRSYEPNVEKLKAQPAGATGGGDHEIAQLACLGAMFAPDPFTAFSQVKLWPAPKAKMRKKDRHPPSAFDAYFLELYQDE